MSEANLPSLLTRDGLTVERQVWCGKVDSPKSGKVGSSR